MDLSRVSAYTPEPVGGAGQQAAVLAPVLVRDGETHVLFTKRADHLGEHPGQMSFPGGSREPEDGTLQTTALREADEEIGLRSKEAAVFGRLDDILTVTDYSVRPFVAAVPNRAYDPDEREVAEVVPLAVSDLADLDNYESERREFSGYGCRRIHYFHVGDYTVWGATGLMLAQLLELTTDWTVPEEPDRVVDSDAELPV
ncbi:MULTISPECIES: CoA pyrophosphatase [Halobellus]|uniref:NUDIX hydrolase n=1 Tax=Halobellus TaxID=1073986 RepID=UPI0021145B02|nr:MULTISPECIES: CoA pyrophosphatase [Halobellus]MDQ2053277.1 CoA pyrophosphatase [Halobellus sp. H-GB7]